MNTVRNLLLFACIAIAVAGIVLFARFAMWWGLSISVQPQNVASLLAPLVLISAFLERAVEVVITPWRDPTADRLQAIIADATATAEEKKNASDSLHAYTGKTMQYAFLALFMFGLVAAMVGVRALWPFLALDPQAMTAFKGASLGQQNTFIVLDVVLSAALMAGGANGIHSAVSAFTAFFDANAQKSQNSVQS